MESKEKEKQNSNKKLKDQGNKKTDVSNSEKKEDYDKIKKNQNKAESLFKNMIERKGKITYYIDEELEKFFSSENKKDEKKDDDKISISTEISMESKWLQEINGTSIEVGVYCLDVSIMGTIAIPLGFSWLAFKIRPELSVGFCVGFNEEINWRKDIYNTGVECYGKAEESVSLEIGIYIPSAHDPVQISFNLGLKGVLVSGKVGVKLSFDKKFVPTVDSYYELQDFVFSFYIRISIEVRLTVFTFAFHFYIYNKTFFGIKIEGHAILSGWNFKYRGWESDYKNYLYEDE